MLRAGAFVGGGLGFINSNGSKCRFSAKQLIPFEGRIVPQENLTQIHCEKPRRLSPPSCQLLLTGRLPSRRG